LRLQLQVIRLIVALRIEAEHEVKIDVTHEQILQIWLLCGLFERGAN